MNQLEILDATSYKDTKVGLMQPQTRRELFKRLTSTAIGAAVLYTLTPGLIKAASNEIWSSSDFGAMFSTVDRAYMLAKSNDLPSPVRENLINAAYRLKDASRPHDIGGILHLHDLIHGSSKARDYAENLANEILENRINTNDFIALETDGYCQGLGNAETLEEKPKVEPTPYSAFGNMDEFNNYLLTYQKRAVLLAIDHAGDIPALYGIPNSSDPLRVQTFYKLINRLQNTPGMRASCQASLGNAGFWGRSIIKIDGDQVYASDFNDSDIPIVFPITRLESVWLPLHLTINQNFEPILNTTYEALAAARRFRNPELDSEIIKLLVKN